jgi:RimJ/RimL family protein N-acetyltransferase
MKDTITITVPVDSGVAEYYRSASDVDRRKIELLVNRHLRDMMALAKRRQEAEAARGECWEADLERRRAELIANLGLQYVPESGKTLTEVMDEISRKAQQRGLTWEILQSILDE